ncbi:MAG: NAD-dependent epimerase/dehydratase family protein [Phenylobacterium sp.]
MKVMVIGATGFIGPPLVRTLADQGHEVVAVARRAQPDRRPGVHALSLDRGDPQAVADAAAGADAVIDLLAMTLATTEPLIEGLAGRVGRYVLASSADVYRQYGALHRREPVEDPGVPPDEAAPLRRNLYPYRTDPRRADGAPDAWMDDYDKIPIERCVLDQPGLPGVVLRLPMVYGPGDRQRRFGWAIRPMLARAEAIDIDAQWAAWRTGYGYVDDVAAGLALAATHPTASGVYNLGPPEAPDHAQWANRFAAALDWPGEVRLMDRELVPAATRAALDALDLNIPMVADTTRIRAGLGYLEVTDPAEALARTIEDETRRIRA